MQKREVELEKPTPALIPPMAFHTDPNPRHTSPHAPP